MHFTITTAASYLGVSVSTMRRLELQGRLIPLQRASNRSHRRYSIEQLESYKAGGHMNYSPSSADLLAVKEVADELGGIESVTKVATALRSLGKRIGGTHRLEACLMVLDKLRQ